MKLIIFDFDGTLADTRAAIVRTMQLAAAEVGLPPVNTTHLQSLIGLPLDESVRIIAPEAPEADVARAVEAYLRIFDEVSLTTVTLFPGVAETLTSLRERGYTLSIATSRGRDSLHRLLAQLGIDGLIDMAVADEDVTAKKPAPDPALALLAAAGCPASDAMVVGDTTYDIEMGTRAGLRTCAVTYGNHSRGQLLEARPSHIINSMTELLDIV